MMKKNKTQSTILIIIVVGLLALAFRDPNYGKWGVPYDLDHAVSRVGGNISSGAEYMKDLVHGKNQEMQDVHDNRMDRNDNRIERAGGKGR